MVLKSSQIRIKLDIGGMTKIHYDTLLFDGKPTEEKKNGVHRLNV